jgi:hypothetical protein
MVRKKGKWFWTTLLVLAGVGGLAHLLSARGIANLLSIFGSYANWVQGIAGLGTIIYVIKQFMK